MQYDEADSPGNEEWFTVRSQRESTKPPTQNRAIKASVMKSTGVKPTSRLGGSEW